MAKLYKALKVPVGEPPVAVSYTWEEIQATCGGLVQSIELGGGCCLLCDDEGKFNGSVPNRTFGRDVLFGDFFLIGTEGDDFADLPEGKMREYADLFAKPEFFTALYDSPSKAFRRPVPYELWQVDDGNQENAAASIRFMRYSAAKRLKYDRFISPQYYKKVYEGKAARNSDYDVMLENIFTIHNMDARPGSNAFRSMSVSDVVVFTEPDGRRKAFYTDSIGFKELPEGNAFAAN